MRERHRFDGAGCAVLAREFNYLFRGSVRNAILRYEASKGLKPDQREGIGAALE